MKVIRCMLSCLYVLGGVGWVRRGRKQVKRKWRQWHSHTVSLVTKCSKLGLLEII